MFPAAGPERSSRTKAPVCQAKGMMSVVSLGRKRDKWWQKSASTKCCDNLQRTIERGNDQDTSSCEIRGDQPMWIVTQTMQTPMWIEIPLTHVQTAMAHVLAKSPAGHCKDGGREVQNESLPLPRNACYHESGRATQGGGPRTMGVDLSKYQVTRADRHMCQGRRAMHLVAPSLYRKRSRDNVARCGLGAHSCCSWRAPAPSSHLQRVDRLC